MPAVPDLRCALLCRSLVVACWDLNKLFINTEKETSITVLEGLVGAELDPYRIIMLYVARK